MSQPKAKKAPREPDLTYADLMSGKKIPPRSLYVAVGSDTFPFTELQKLFEREFLPGDTSGMNRVVFDCDGNTRAPGIISACEEYPFGSRHKLVILKNAQRIPSKEGDAIKEYLQNPSPASIILMLENSEEARTLSGRFSPSRAAKGPLKNSALVISCQLDFAGLREWVRARFEAEGKKTGRSSVELLLERVGQDLWDLSQEIEKISIYAGKRELVKDEDVMAMTSLRTQSKIFDLNERVGMKKTGDAIMVLNELLRDRDTGFQVPAALNNHFAFLFRMSRLQDQGLSPDEIAKKVQKHPFYVKKSLQQARNFTQAAYETAFDILARADGGIKQGMDTRRVLELTILQICRL